MLAEDGSACDAINCLHFVHRWTQEPHDLLLCQRQYFLAFIHFYSPVI